MTNITRPSPQGKSDISDTIGERDLMLMALRAGAARSRLIATEIDSIHTCLRQKKIDCAQALAWAKEKGLSSWIKLGPEGQQ